jgi:hypothetical protein
VSFNFGGTAVAFKVHLWTGSEPVDDEQTRPRFLCIDMGERMRGSTICTWTDDKAKVTCAACLEWMHA